MFHSCNKKTNCVIITEFKILFIFMCSLTHVVSYLLGIAKFWAFCLWRKWKIFHNKPRQSVTGMMSVRGLQNMCWQRASFMHLVQCQGYFNDNACYYSRNLVVYKTMYTTPNNVHYPNYVHYPNNVYYPNNAHYPNIVHYPNNVHYYNNLHYQNNVHYPYNVH